MTKPEILAPAGDMPSFLAALAAGADAVYLGLKHFSARMQADNFSTTELSRMVNLANQENRRIYVAFNTVIKQNELPAAGRLIARLARDVHPHGLIVQDPGMLDVIRQTGYEGITALSTLANLTHPAALAAAADLGARRVILPRELSIDEIRSIAASCPDGLELEMFIHGALCWCVSGRCYWSSYMGGKSGLRGRCVQPCRRMYAQQSRKGRFFSCLDFSLDVLARTLCDIPHLACWKIEGRKKGPHYVYHAVTAYRILRDEGDDPQARKEAVRILEMALGRQSTRAKFLPQHAAEPTNPDLQTSSGLAVGKIKADGEGRVAIRPYIDLIPGDYLRIGYEDEDWHATIPVTRRTPKAGTLVLKTAKHKTPGSGTPVFLIDRREPDLMRVLGTWRKKLESQPSREASPIEFSLHMPRAIRSRKAPDIIVRSVLPTGTETRRRRGSITGIWLTPKSVRSVSRTVAPDMSWWLPPVIWPDEEDLWRRILREASMIGARNFVCNAPWQARLFDSVRDARLTAGPFCNICNAMAIAELQKMGFTAVFASPELNAENFLALPKCSPLPLGMLLSGFWPMGISRHTPTGIRDNEPFKSPKGEVFWTRRYGKNTWIYPGWPIDLSAHREELENAGYSFFARFEEMPPASLPQAKRPGLFNWNGDLL
ncbi:MAG: U32 family peptidase [Desulfovibrionaceae bacterium]|nr:U32 family peptidase [Desulfovibrionaceae bacterium]